MSEDIIIPILIGVGLSAATGFRIFVPFLVLSFFSIVGDVNLSPEFEWIATYPALITFGVATLVEIGGYYIPWLDNLLDTIATPVAAIAGVIIMAAVMNDMSPLLKWALAIIAGGGIAGTIQSATGLLRVGSTTTTGGIANPVLSTTEAGVSFGLSILAVIIPIAAMLIILVLFYRVFNKFGGKIFRRSSKVANVNHHKQ